MTRYTCQRMRAIEGGDIEGAARTFALRVARKKFGPKGECRSLYLRTDLGAIGASFEAFIGILHVSGATLGERYRFTVLRDGEVTERM
jgi:hypothetical protein